MIAEEVTVTEGHGPGEAGQERSRRDQDRPGRSGLGVRERTADRKSTRLNSSHIATSRMPSSA